MKKIKPRHTVTRRSVLQTGAGLALGGVLGSDVAAGADLVELSLRYAQEASWREDNRRSSNGEQVNRLACLAMKRGKSVDFSGYWQRHVTHDEAAN